MVRGLRLRLRSVDGLHDSREVLGSGSAASANDADAEIFDEFRESVCHRLRLERIDRFAYAGVDWQSGVRDDGKRECRVLREIADGLAHVFGPGRAIQSDDIDLQRL